MSKTNNFNTSFGINPAFPMSVTMAFDHQTGVPIDICHLSGLEKREMIAAMALQGILAHSFGSISSQWAAACSVEFADALLKHLDATKE